MRRSRKRLGRSYKVRRVDEVKMEGIKTVTRITTIKVTNTETVSSEQADRITSKEAQEQWRKILEAGLRADFNADDVHVQVQDFIMDK